MNWTTYIYWTLKVLVNSYRLGCIIWKDTPDFLAHILWILCPPLYWLSSGWQKWWSWIVESPYSRHSHPPLVMESYPPPSGTRPKSGMIKAECDKHTYTERWAIQSNFKLTWNSCSGSHRGQDWPECCSCQPGGRSRRWLSSFPQTINRFRFRFRFRNIFLHPV